MDNYIINQYSVMAFTFNCANLLRWKLNKYWGNEVCACVSAVIFSTHIPSM